MTVKHIEMATKHVDRQANMNRTQQERDDNLTRAKRGYQSWLKTDRREDWKEYTRRKQLISKNFLTRNEAGIVASSPEQANPIRQFRRKNVHQKE